MPELPEVETIKDQLSKKIRGKIIKDLQVIDYQKNVQGRVKDILARITDIKRRAKLLIFHLANRCSFLIHLKLTGQLVYHEKPKEISPSTKIVFTFQDGSRLFFNDFRKFGFLKIMETREVESYLKKEGYGPEPLELSSEEFKRLLTGKPKARIKPLLMDQTFLAGLGNIYAQEACFLAGILPTRIISSLSEEEIKKLYQAIQKILSESIRHQGTSFDTTYVTPENKPGGFDAYLKVYHQEKCSSCHTKLKIISLGGRSTYYCPKCQK